MPKIVKGIPRLSTLPMFRWNTINELGRGEKRLGAGQAPNRAAAVLIAAIGAWVHIRATQTQAIRIEVTAGGRRPIVAVATSTAGRAIIEAARVEEVIGESAVSFGHISAGRSSARRRRCACATKLDI